MNKKTELMELVETMQHDDSHIGDLCKDIIRDLKFPTLGTEIDQIRYLVLIGKMHDRNVKNAIIDLFEILELKDSIDEFHDELFLNEEEQDGE